MDTDSYKNVLDPEFKKCTQISIVGARSHNLKNLSIQIPIGRWTAITGVSGSGKSSLAFDTLHAEGQRRYFETLSASSRLFLQQLERPDVDRIEHLPPSIAIGQTSRPQTGTSQLCDATSILENLAMIAMHAGVMHCPDCKIPVTASEEKHLVERISRLPEKTKIQIAFPLDVVEGESVIEVKRRWEQEGFHRFITLKPNQTPFDSLILVDRITAHGTSLDRMSESIEQAFSAGQNGCVLLLESTAEIETHEKQNEKEAQKLLSVQDESGKTWLLEFFLQQPCCCSCYRKYPEIDLFLFRRSSPVGACETCLGAGSVRVKKTNLVCNDCNGLGLNDLASEVHVASQKMQQLLQNSCENVLEILNDSEELMSKKTHPAAIESVQNLRVKLESLCVLGLGYLKLNRKLTTLSTGEYQRVALSNTLCAQLVNTLYVFDEPSTGLHQHDLIAVRDSMKNLCEQDNTVVMVEHHAEMISQVDHLIELGPGAGLQGGEVIFEGSYQNLLTEENSGTAKWIRGQKELPEFTFRPITEETDFLTAQGVCCQNVRDVSVEFPLQRMTVITGVSGSGKTSLLCNAIYPALCRVLAKIGGNEEEQNFEENMGTVAHFSGYESIAEVILVNDAAVARSIRSTPITYLKAFDEIRKLFASTVDAQTLGFKPTRFSFNSAAGGRCTHCSGNGIIEIDMHFLANQTVVCPECKGKRFNSETLSVKYRGRNIHDMLSMTIDEAFTFFHNHQSLQRRLQTLREVGLGYLRTGQSLATLSGGEAQRLKLASFLSESSGKSKLYLFDEATAGLHPSDVATLLSCFRRLVEQGHTVVAIDHHQLMLQATDWVIDLGPAAASQGGEILFAGIPSELQNCQQSVTAKYLPNNWAR